MEESKDNLLMNIKNDEKHRAHFACIQQSAGKFNVMSSSEIQKGYESFLENHVNDALMALNADVSWENKRVADVGSGAGIPGIPLAIELNECITSMHLIEATSKKAQFLSSVTKALSLRNISILNDRAETLGRNREYRASFDIVLTRAVGYLDECLELTLPLLNVGGHSILYRGEISSHELELVGQVANNLGGKVSEIVDYHPANFAKPRHILVIRKNLPTPQQYPRTPGAPKKHSIFKDS
jgi:16S rRNA (guanine527-N7)-methyltransferase